MGNLYVDAEAHFSRDSADLRYERTPQWVPWLVILGTDLVAKPILYHVEI